MDYIGKEIRRRPLVISGSDDSTFLRVEQADSGSTAIFTNNVQNGYPTSNPWGSGLDGSFFNNFDNTTCLFFNNASHNHVSINYDKHKK